MSSERGRLSLASMLGMMSEVPPAPKWVAIAMRPDIHQKLVTDARFKASRNAPPFSITIAVKHGQAAASWAFSDLGTCRKYINDELSELDLMELVRAGRTEPTL